jgi:hypothetical protein
VHMVRLQMSLDDLTFLLPGQSMEDFPPRLADFPKHNLPPSLRATHIMRTFLRPPPFTIVGILSSVSLSVLLGG